MKHKLLHLFAAMSGAVLLCTAASAPAAAVSGALSEKQPPDDKVMIGDMLIYHLKLESDNDGFVTLVTPYDDIITFTLRPDRDDDKSLRQTLDIILKYIPSADFEFFRSHGAYTGNTLNYNLRVNNDSKGSAEISDALLHDLAAAGLICEYYTWEQAGYYQYADYSFNLSAYTEYDLDTHTGQERDLTPLCSFLAEHHPGWTIENEYWKLKDYNEEGVMYEYSERHCRLQCSREHTDEETIAVHADLYEAFPDAVSIWTAGPQDLYSNGNIFIGENALAKPCDVNLDCSVDVADAVLLARYINSDSEAAVCEQGIRNASADGSTQVTTDDITRILMKIAKKQ